jgi:hypothetical protein
VSTLRLFLTVVLVALVATYVIVESLHDIRSRIVTLETYDVAEAREFMLACSGPVTVQTFASRYTLVCRRGTP